VETRGTVRENITQWKLIIVLVITKIEYNTMGEGERERERERGIPESSRYRSINITAHKD
jgi:hypothetical protein